MYEFPACFMQYQATAIKTICDSADVNSVVTRDAKLQRVVPNGHLKIWEEQLTQWVIYVRKGSLKE